MPKANCPQSNAWCPHFDPAVCRDTRKDEHDPCVHARAFVSSGRALSMFTKLAVSQGLISEAQARAALDES